MKKGFTLVELLTVIILLGIISLIAVPMVTDQISLAQEQAYQQNVVSIEDAARRYGTTNMLGYSTVEQKLELSTLISAGILDEKDLKNPKTKKQMTGCVYYKWNESNNIYEYRYDPNC